MKTLVDYNLTGLSCAGFSDSEFDSFEFCVFLQPSDDKAASIASWQRMWQTARLDLAGSAAEAARQLEAQAICELEQELDRLRSQVTMLAQERQVILNSTLWRATAPLRLAARAIPGPVRRWLHERL